MSCWGLNVVLLIPAYNEEASLPALLQEIQELYPDLPVVVINDASTDNTSKVVRETGATVLDLPINLGVAGAMQTGFKWAVEQGYDYAMRCDSDGQHPPENFPAMVECMKSTQADLVIGSRFLGDGDFKSEWKRRIGIGYLSLFLSIVCKHPVTDPTSGFQIVNRLLMYYFAHHYPQDYPEPESLALLRRQGYSFAEVGARFQARTGGVSSLQGLSSLYFAYKVTLALLVDRARGVHVAFSRHELEGRLG